MKRFLTAVLLVMLATAGARASPIAPIQVDEEGFSLSHEGFVVWGSHIVYLGQAVFAGQHRGDVGTRYAVYYAGYDREAQLLHLRTVWETLSDTFRGAELLSSVDRGDWELLVPLNQDGLTTVDVDFVPGRMGRDPLMRLRIVGVDDQLRLRIAPPELGDLRLRREEKR